MSLKNTKIQSLLFSNDKFTEEQSKQWAKEHHFREHFGNKKSADVTENFIRLRQKNPSKKPDTKFATIEITDGVHAVIEYKEQNFTAKGHAKKKTQKPEDLPPQ